MSHSNSEPEATALACASVYLQRQFFTQCKGEEELKSQQVSTK